MAPEKNARCREMVVLGFAEILRGAGPDAGKAESIQFHSAVCLLSHMQPKSWRVFLHLHHEYEVSLSCSYCIHGYVAMKMLR